jgi:phosphonate transport system permease protein
MMAATRYDHGGAQGRWHWTAPRPEGAMGWVAYAATALAIAWVLHWSAGGAQMSWGELARGMPQIADFLSRSVPPDWSILPRLWAPALETVQIAVWGTLLSVLLALPLSFIAAGNLHGWHWLRRATRQFLNVVRSINELILALVFVSAVGLGPFPGVLALALHGMGMLGKFFAESIEEIDDGPLQALRSAGATQLQLIVFGVIPQAITAWIAVVLYRFEVTCARPRCWAWWARAAWGSNWSAASSCSATRRRPPASWSSP